MARLPQGMRRTPNGKIELRFSYNGKRYSVTGIDVPDVLEKEREKLEELQTTGYVLNKDIRIEQYYVEFLKLWGNGVKPATANIFKICCRKYVLPALGKCKVKDLEVRQIQDFYDSLIDVKGIKVTTANEYLTGLSKMLKEACNDGIRKDNPCTRVRRRKNTEARAIDTIHRALSKEEQEQFEKAIKGSWSEYFIMFMLYTGCRCGEVAALKWSDIDFKNNTIQIKRTVTKDENGKKVISKTTKTKSGEREIPLKETPRKCLLEQKKRNFALYGKAGKEDMIFLSPNYGRIIDVSLIERAIKIALRKMPGVEKFTSHALRDTFATRFLEAGGSMKALQVILGHADYKTTANLYAHVLPDTKAEEMERMEQYVQEKRRKGGKS